jgi:ubiquinone/menaquinone biosynthesis C-methylase UbiE
MNKDYLNYICCPDCKNSLTAEDGVFICKVCNKSYEVGEDIPILIDKNELNKHLFHQIAYFERETNTRVDNYELEEWQKMYIGRFLDNFGIIHGKVVLDCGCGSGYMTIELLKRGNFVIACDLTFKSLMRLKKIAEKLNLDDKLLLVCCSADNLPFRDEIADYFISNAVLEHLEKENAAIWEINRVCKMGAGLMVGVPLSYKYLNPILIPVNFMHDKRIGHLRRYNLQTIRNKFKEWFVVKTYYTGHFAKVSKTLINMLKKTFNEECIEKEDKIKKDKKWGASNIICLLRKEDALFKK